MLISSALRRLLKSIVLGFMFVAVTELAIQDASAETARHRGPYIWSGVYLGAPLTWGWYGPWLTGHYPITPYGYSYWSYYNYQPRYASFGAISYSKATNTFGGAWGQNTRWSAEASAKSYCGQEDCQTAVWVQGGCAAVASMDNGDHLGWAYHTDQYTARHYALHACRQSGEGICKVRYWVCSY